jgi:hypothetical protein
MWLFTVAWFDYTLRLHLTRRSRAKINKKNNGKRALNFA